MYNVTINVVNVKMEPIVKNALYPAPRELNRKTVGALMDIMTMDQTELANVIFNIYSIIIFYFN